MTSLRARIEAKARRTVTLPIAVGNVTAAAAAVASANAALEEHLSAVARQRRIELDRDQTPEEIEREAALRADLAAAIEQAGEGVALVELQSVPDEEWDALFGEIVPDADGEVPLDECRAAMLAACAVDPELQDEQWWAAQLARPEWTKGDVMAADHALIRLNQSAPTGAQGKG